MKKRNVLRHVSRHPEQSEGSPDTREMSRNTRHDVGVCKRCRACHLLIQGIHPDIHYIRPEGTSSAIKVEHVRERMIRRDLASPFIVHLRLGFRFRL